MASSPGPYHDLSGAVLRPVVGTRRRRTTSPYNDKARGRRLRDRQRQQRTSLGSKLVALPQPEPQPEPQLGAMWHPKLHLQPEPQTEHALQPEPEPANIGQHTALHESPSMVNVAEKLIAQKKEELDQIEKQREKLLGDIRDSQPNERLEQIANFDVSFTQLLDENDCDEYRVALLHAAGTRCGAKKCETCKRDNLKERPGLTLDEDDRSTWTIENLGGKSIEELARLRAKISPLPIESRVRFPIRLIPLRQFTSNLFWGKKMFLFPEDKFELTQTSHSPVKLYLGRDAFEAGTSFSTKKQLQELRDLLFVEPDKSPSKDPFLMLTSSPLHAITLPEDKRSAMSIPRDAKFYSFCYSATQDPEHTAAARGEGPNRWDKRRTEDPFVKWLTTGGFIYYSHNYEVVAINAVSFDPRPATDATTQGEQGERPHPGDYFFKGSVLWFSGMDAISSQASESGKAYLRPAVVAALDDLDRWWPVTHSGLRDLGFEKVAWITPSEFLGGYIFTESGGFAYRDEKDAEHSKSIFYPVQPKPTGVWKAGERWVPRKYEAPMHIPGMSGNEVKSVPGAEKAKFHHHEAFFADGSHSALGLHDLIDESKIPADEDKAVQRIVEEVNAAADGGSPFACPYGTDKMNVEYVALKPAQSSDKCPWGDQDWNIKWDTGRDGWTLDDFQNGHKHPDALQKQADDADDPTKKQRLLDEKKSFDVRKWPAKQAKLKKPEIVALRLYTTSTFRLINQPLRECSRRGEYATTHNSGTVNSDSPRAAPTSVDLPLPVTTHFIDSALKKLRVCHMGGGERFKERHLWRGLKNMSVNDKFLLKGGCEYACMSATEDVKVMAMYAHSEEPLVFRIKVDSPMELGADISWLSVYPGESEVLYPPMTFLKPLFRQRIREKDKGEVISMKPTFSS